MDYVLGIGAGVVAFMWLKSTRVQVVEAKAKPTEADRPEAFDGEHTRKGAEQVIVTWIPEPAQVDGHTGPDEAPVAPSLRHDLPEEVELIEPENKRMPAPTIKPAISLPPRYRMSN